MPRVGYLDAVYGIFWYLKCCIKKKRFGQIVFDPVIPHIAKKLFSPQQDGMWKDFYKDEEEQIPCNAPASRGRSVTILCYVDAEHAGNLMTNGSNSEILIYINNTPIIWYSKRQNTAESSSFCSEFIALRIATEMIESLRYKLRMFGVDIVEPTSAFCDNKSVVTNAIIPTTSMTNKKHNSICYHKVRESYAAGTTRVGWVLGEYNKSDSLTKTSLSTTRYDLSNSIFDN